jgi:hypothetical protein
MADSNEKQGFREKVTIMLGACPANIDKEQLVASIRLAQERIHSVLQGGEILSGFEKNGGSLNKLQRLNDQLGGVLNALEKVDNVCKDIEALQSIYGAMVDISPDDFRSDPRKTAKAFDKLFVGLGRLCRLTTVLKPYEQFFESFGGFYKSFAELRLRKEAEVYTDQKGGRNYAGE